MRRIRAPRSAFVLAAALLACGSPTLSEGVTLETYVEAMAALRRIQDDPSRTAAAKQVSRDSVLKAYEVTPAQLESAAAVLAADPTRAFATWQAIERRVSGKDSVAAPPAGTVAPESPTPAAPAPAVPSAVTPGGSSTPR